MPYSNPAWLASILFAHTLAIEALSSKPNRSRGSAAFHDKPRPSVPIPHQENAAQLYEKMHRVDHRSQQYSTLAISDSSGYAVDRIAYTAHEQPTFTNAAGLTLSSSTKATRYSYAGREWAPSLACASAVSGPMTR